MKFNDDGSYRFASYARFAHEHCVSFGVCHPHYLVVLLIISLYSTIIHAMPLCYSIETVGLYQLQAKIVLGILPTSNVFLAKPENSVVVVEVVVFLLLHYLDQFD